MNVVVRIAALLSGMIGFIMAVPIASRSHARFFRAERLSARVVWSAIASCALAGIVFGVAALGLCIGVGSIPSAALDVFLVGVLGALFPLSLVSTLWWRLAHRRAVRRSR